MSGAAPGRASAVASDPPATPSRRPERGSRAPPWDAHLQERAPVDALALYLDGFHYYDGRRDATTETHQWCTPLTEDAIAQCVIFDGAGRNAKLIGVEYVAGERAYARLPAEEKRLWHRHAWDVRSGTLAAPGLGGETEREVVRRYAHTYGKTWSTWHTEDGDAMPVGTAQLMFGFTGDDQIDRRAVAARDQRLGQSTAARERDRADLDVPEVDEGGEGATRLALGATGGGEARDAARLRSAAADPDR